jgi:hypothetical protein
MAVLGINYDGGGYVYDENDERTDEFVPLEYQSVYLSTQNEKFEFNSGNFIVDWYNAIKKFYNELLDVEPHLSHSSSVNHFIMDGAPYSSAYGHWDTGDKLILKYLDENWSDTVEGMVKARKIYEGGVELFVEDGTTPTFEELKEYVNEYIGE